MTSASSFLQQQLRAKAGDVLQDLRKFLVLSDRRPVIGGPD
jgi:hypothetical protein